MSTPLRRMCLHLPFISTDEVRRRQAARLSAGHALLLTRTVGLAQIVARVDALAMRAGVRPEMSLAQARAIAPDAIALPHDPQADGKTLDRLADWAIRFSPLVEPAPPDTLLVDITGCEMLFGGQERIAQLALAGLADAGFFARAAVADTVGAAHALATSARRPISIAPPAETTASLASLPPPALRLEPQVASRLEALGILTIGDLLKLPRSALPARFGPGLNLRLQQALGEVFEGVAVRLPRSVPYARLEFEHPIRELLAIQAAAADLLNDVFVQLERRGEALRRLDVLLLVENRPQRLAVALARASRRREHVWQLLQQRLEACDLEDGATGLVLMAGETARSPAPQGELFEAGQEPQQEEQLGLLLDRLANRLGRPAVVRAELVDDYQPEKAVGYTPATDRPPGDGSRNQLSASAGGVDALRAKTPPARGKRRKARPDPKPATRWQPLRPTHLLARPLPIRVISEIPDGPPTWFACRGREYIVRAAWGPERIETAWWRGADVRRDYFRLETESGAQFWVYHSFDDQKWYLHGVFA